MLPLQNLPYRYENIQFAAIAASSANATAVVSAQGTGKKIRVLAYFVSAAGAVNVKFQSASTDKTGLHYLAAAGSQASVDFSPVGYFETAANEALNIHLSGAVAVGGHLAYVVI